MSLAVKAKLDPEQTSGHSKRIGAAQDMLSGGTSIGQIMVKVRWSKVDTVMRYAGVGTLTALNYTQKVATIFKIPWAHPQLKTQLCFFSNLEMSRIHLEYAEDP